jgi:HAD superfamily phosphoserine phosphatase-like hydrolase
MSEVIEPQIRKEAIGLVNHHLVKGDICCIVTATNSFVTRPIAKRFGIDHLIATEPETVLLQDKIQFTGRVNGAPNFKEGKVVHVQNWLRKLGYDWQSLQESIFYSDSMNDLPLLQQVKTPVATNPDERLRAHATLYQWQILDLFA